MVADFTNKVVLVTGASAGIGEAIALLFAKLGAKLAIVGRDAGNLGSVAKRCQAEKGLAPLAIVADLATDAGCDKTAKDTLVHFGRLDVLINNVGVGARTCIQRADMETFDRVFSTNVRGVYNLTRQLVPALIKSKGNIVNISSIAGTCVSVGSLPYGMSKISKFVQRLTDYTEEQYQAWLQEASGSIPLGRVCSGEDIAKMVAHLASDELSALVTGTVVQVDGGLQYSSVGGLMQKQMK
ncbi:uncharacterized protein LOC114357292 isoform X8 [Ostrinia furnacalis]|uniref:uncharacterized protein LOC114357292 isoform X8 n=1 Tax=Ostrinia furnacalis TaxID=93504 RepID=UPI00103EEEC5|nr:uncharacterized protein LOC114357292 isoform X8 [Ostrinia furnacalis]